MYTRITNDLYNKCENDDGILLELVVCRDCEISWKRVMKPDYKACEERNRPGDRLVVVLVTAAIVTSAEAEVCRSVYSQSLHIYIY